MKKHHLTEEIEQNHKKYVGVFVRIWESVGYPQAPDPEVIAGEIAEKHGLDMEMFCDFIAQHYNTTASTFFGFCETYV